MSSASARLRHRAIREESARLGKAADDAGLIVVVAGLTRWRAEELPEGVGVVVAKGTDESVFVILHKEDTLAIRNAAFKEALVSLGILDA